MSTLNIMLQDRDAVTEFVAATTSMPFDMDLVQGSRVVDAKSLLGILYMGLGKVLNLKLDTEHLPTAKQILHKFIVELAVTGAYRRAERFRSHRAESTPIDRAVREQ